MRTPPGVAAVLAVLLIVLAASAASAASAAPQDPDLPALVSRVAGACVIVGGGSGVLVSADGLVLTCAHVVGVTAGLPVMIRGVSHPARVLGTDPLGDVALLRIEGAAGLPCLSLGDSDALRVGQRVLALGNPFGYSERDWQPTVTLGVVSALHRFQGGYSDAIQTDAPINPGNSGGPLLDLAGDVVGINGRVAVRFGDRVNTGVGYAIPSNQLRRFLPLLEEAEGGSVEHALLEGVRVEAGDDGGSGAQVESVLPGSVAAEAGFRSGDRIVAVESLPVPNGNRFHGILGTFTPGSRLRFAVRRGLEEEEEEEEEEE
ncbi:MAG: trypsin-like peptidase domain-containing protein, partial [Planctomycetes bacterium]|nr:trypsin-like peptidase domain-containing protein [Planctomycetota bacterium]